MSVKRVLRLASAYRWPLYLGGILMLSVCAQGVMVYFATRADAPRAEPDYYGRALRWDVDQAVREASVELGWRVTFEVPGGVQYLAGMARPIDVTVVDVGGAAVSGLVGEVVAVRPADTRLNAKAQLTELPHARGRYRGLIRLDASGLWELNLDVRQEGLRFVHSARVMVAGEGEG